MGFKSDRDRVVSGSNVSIFKGIKFFRQYKRVIKVTHVIVIHFSNKKRTIPKNTPQNMFKMYENALLFSLVSKRFLFPAARFLSIFPCPYIDPFQQLLIVEQPDSSIIHSNRKRPSRPVSNLVWGQCLQCGNKIP